jgi:hypothetical protein
MNGALANNQQQQLEIKSSMGEICFKILPEHNLKATAQNHSTSRLGLQSAT